MENILVIIESDWVKEMRFIEFGLLEAFATQLHLKCSVQHVRQKWNQVDIDHGINLFVGRAKHMHSAHIFPDRYLHLATGAVTLELEGVQQTLYFVVIAVFMRGKIADLVFEPLTDIDHEPALDEFVEARMEHAGFMCPAFFRSRKKREEIDALVYATLCGFEIGKELRSWLRGSPVPTAARISQH